MIPSLPRRLHRGGRGVLAMAIALVLACSGSSLAQFSPGPLSRAHQELEGALSCTKCHELGVDKGPSDARCLECHKLLKARIDASAGFHGREGRSAGCARCHSEHNGRDFDLVGLDRERFDHGQTGHPLAGKHASLSCEKCHRAPRGFLGLVPSCGSCHEDPHRGQLGGDCAGCHGETSWKPATGFDHGKTRYPLTGSHGAVPCSKCHLEGRYKGLRFDDCAACHETPHSAAFQAGRACSACHATAGWSAGASAGFDHSRTPFPLAGAHQRTACAACHKGGRYRSLGGATCETCHQDPHQGQFKPAGRACVDCHDLNAWRPAPRFDHAATRYPLTGKHAQVACARCHAAGRYSGAPAVCSSCHQDPHRAELGSDCGRCHTPAAWNETLFRHETTKFPLSGKHGSAACRRCHRAGGDARYFRLDPACGACHADPHHGQFTWKYPDPSAFGGRMLPPPATPVDSIAFASRVSAEIALGRTQCAVCHAPGAWKPSSYDHEKSRFKLDGKHATVACGLCHKDGKFAETPSDCSDCHKDPHWGQFAQRTCGDCHTSAGWPEVRFDHRGHYFRSPESTRTSPARRATARGGSAVSRPCASIATRMRTCRPSEPAAGGATPRKDGFRRPSSTGSTSSPYGAHIRRWIAPRATGTR